MTILRIAALLALAPLWLLAPLATITGPVPPTPTPSVASWYGPGFAGRLTAYGQIFDPGKLTTASRVHHPGTLLRVALRGRSVDVEVNDCGPYIDGRDLDLSRAAAEEIGLVGAGVALVFVSVVSVPDPPRRITCSPPTHQPLWAVGD